MTVEEGLNIWTTDSEIVFFFEKVLHSARPKPADNKAVLFARISVGSGSDPLNLLAEIQAESAETLSQ